LPRKEFLPGQGGKKKKKPQKKKKGPRCWDLGAPPPTQNHKPRFQVTITNIKSKKETSKGWEKKTDKNGFRAVGFKKKKPGAKKPFGVKAKGDPQKQKKKKTTPPNGPKKKKKENGEKRKKKVLGFFPPKAHTKSSQKNPPGTNPGFGEKKTLKKPQTKMPQYPWVKKKKKKPPPPHPTPF